MLFKTSAPKRASLNKVLHVPKLACNLFSIRAAASNGNGVKFNDSKCWIRQTIGELRSMGFLWASYTV